MNKPSDIVRDFGLADPDIILSSARYLVERGYSPVSAGTLAALLDVSTAPGEKWIAAILKHFPDEWETCEGGIAPKRTHEKA